MDYLLFMLQMLVFLEHSFSTGQRETSMFFRKQPIQRPIHGFIFTDFLGYLYSSPLLIWLALKD